MLKRKTLTDKEIAEYYQDGIAPVMPILENLIDKFKNDKTSLDIQQLQLVTTFLIAEREFDEKYINELEQETENFKGDK